MAFFSKYERRILAWFCVVMLCGLLLTPFEKRQAGFLRFIARLEEKSFHPVFDLNSVTFDELENVDGIGRNNAEWIIRHRLDYGPYENVDELTEVEGLPRRTAERLRAYFYVTR